MNPSSKHQSAGFSLVEVLVAVGVLSIIVLGLTSMIQQTNHSQQDLKQRFELTNLQGTLIRVMNSDKMCTGNLQSLININPSNPPPPSIAVPLIRTFNNAGAPVDVVVTSGAALPGGSAVVISAMDLVNISRINPNLYSADLQLQTNRSGMIDLKPIVVTKIFLKTQLSGGVDILKSCGISDSARATYTRGCAFGANSSVNVNSPPVCVPPSCAAGHTQLGVGTNCTVQQNYSGYQVGECYVTCTGSMTVNPSNSPVTAYKTECGWSLATNPNGSITACTPPLCNPGDEDMGTGGVGLSTSPGGGSGYSSGANYRWCFTIQ